MTAAQFLVGLLSVLALACTTWGLGLGMIKLVEFYERRARERKA